MPSPASEFHFSISTAARLAGMHVNTLRKYERHGFISPGRTTGNQRSFTAEDLTRLRQIKRLVDDRGLNLAGVEIALTVTDRIMALRETGAGRMVGTEPELLRAMDAILLDLQVTFDLRGEAEDSWEDTGD